MSPGRFAEMSSYMLDFNNHIQSYFISSTYGNETLVNRCLEQLASGGESRTFDVSGYQCNVFFVNLHKLLSHSLKKSNLLWSVVGVLEVAVNDDETRLALVNKFRFLPVVSLLLLELHTPDQQKRVLSLLHHLSYGANVDGQEMFLERLIQKLLSLIEQNHQKKERCEVAQLALSILVNLCHRDLSTTFVLTRNTNISAFCKQIKKFGLLACKMYIILEQNDYIKEMDLHYLLRMSFEEVRLMLASQNSFSLKHVVDFLRYVKTLGDTSGSQPVQAVVTDEYFNRDLKEFLLEIEKHWDAREKNGSEAAPKKKGKRKVELKKNRTTDGLFEILECIVSLKPDDSELYRKICEFGPIRLINNATEDCSKAVDLLCTILEKNSKDAAFAEECKAVLGNLMTTLTNNDDERLAIAFARLLTTIGRALNASDDTMNEVAEQFYQHLFGSMVNQAQETVPFDYSIADGPARVYQWALHAFNELANLSPTHWYAKVTNLFKQKPIQFLVAKALTGGSDLELLEAMLQVASSTDFPKHDVAIMIDMLKTNGLTSMVTSPVHDCKNGLLQPPTGYSFVRALSRDLQDRMDQAVVQMQDAKAAGLINDVEKSELVEFYTYKINMQTNLMNDLRISLESTTTQITTLMHQNQLLMAEIDKNQKKSLPLLLKESALENENRLLERELVMMKSAAATYDKKTNQMKQELAEYIKKYGEKSQKCAVLVKEIEHLRTRDDNYEKENKRLHAELAVMTKNRDDARKLLKLGEEDRQKLTEQRDAERKQFECKLREREREISKRNDLVQQLEQTLMQRDGSIESLEADVNDMRTKLKDREDRIAQLEEDLKENEKIQQAIYSLMNKNKK
ncbi:uncharacterized protein LOC131282936 [Anopheles ziemanni]|uniref:uncharacterized protein LOC131262857 n=1 Tax=Anopheles coustani TaxID=139045 RepID=UPI002658933F|nr:uncharacterized protein LOC131262857 [Anopheles coustani]XP_058168470.1 uncharacterized protein LOC131282936 [Anopheles ziemanni]